MTGHLSVPALDNSNLPASLSKKIITGLLREKLNYNGIIITDALDMKAITNKFSNDEAVIMAIEAGNDILLLAPEPISAIETLEKKAETDTEFRKKLIESVERIRQAKKWCGLLETNNIPEEISVPFSEHEKLALEIAYDAVELIGNQKIIPIDEESIVAGFAFLQTEDIDTPAMFFRILGQAINNDCDFGFIDKDILETISILFGNPYLKDAIKADLIISPYSDSLPALAAVIMKMSGRKTK